MAKKLLPEKSKPGPHELFRMDYHPANFIEQSKQGRNIKQIAKSWDIARSTVYDWAGRHPSFADTIKRGQEYCEAWYMDLGQAAMVGAAKIDGKPIKVDLGWFVWMTKNICKWSDKIDQKIEGGDRPFTLNLTMPANGSEAAED